jgi:4-carboxymuconolactone decarboxylase
MSDTPTFGRYAELPYETMTPEQQEGYRAMIETRGGLPGPSKIWVHNPKLAKVVGPFGAHFQAGHYALTEREREIAVCVITSRFHSAYPITDVITLMGHYSSVAMTLAFYDVPAGAIGMAR